MDVDFDADSLSVDEEEQSSGSPLKKKTAGRWRGAAIYKTKFNHSWQKKWPFLSVVKEDPHSCHCSVCNKRVSCGHHVSYQHVSLIFVHSHTFFNILSLMFTRCSWNLWLTVYLQKV